MKKFILIAGSVLSLSILVSLSYQPIVAEKPIIITNENIEISEKEDCGCISKDKSWIPPFRCLTIAMRLLMLSILLGLFILDQDFWLVDYWVEKYFELEELYLELNCDEFPFP